jgi:hypothetical protein
MPCSAVRLRGPRPHALGGEGTGRQDRPGRPRDHLGRAREGLTLAAVLLGEAFSARVDCQEEGEGLLLRRGTTRSVHPNSLTCGVRVLTVLLSPPQRCDLQKRASEGNSVRTLGLVSTLRVVDLPAFELACSSSRPEGPEGSWSPRTPHPLGPSLGTDTSRLSWSRVCPRGLFPFVKEVSGNDFPEEGVLMGQYLLSTLRS